MLNRLKRATGLSIIEVLVSFGILASGILAIIGVFPQAYNVNNDNWVNTQVTILAQQTMDNILADNSFISTIPIEVSPVPEHIPRDKSGDPQGFVRYWGEPDPGGNTNIQIIKVQVQWIEDGRTKNYVLSSAVVP
ncbi:MAG: hypothetical protein ACLFQV_02495 [Vulcanimicrobiota bacterium]